MAKNNQKILTIVLSNDNKNDDIRTLEDLMHFILNELENANVGALLKIENLESTKGGGHA